MLLCVRRTFLRCSPKCCCCNGMMAFADGRRFESWFVGLLTPWKPHGSPEQLQAVKEHAPEKAARA
jgi:hypothetical protein